MIYLTKQQTTDEIVKKIDAKLGKKSAQINCVWQDTQGEILVLESKPISLKSSANLGNSLSDYNLFPDIYWLFDKKLCKKIAELETSGLTKILQKKLLDDEAFFNQFKLAVLDFKLRRKMLISASQVFLIKKFNLEKIFFETGISGVKDIFTIKCLHSHYAHYLVSQGVNPVGKHLVENYNLPCINYTKAPVAFSKDFALLPF